MVKEFKSNTDDLLECVEIDIKYSGYINREKNIADKIKRLERIKIHESIKYSELKSISFEGRQKLERIRPKTIGQASRISGVSPADLSLLAVWVKRHKGYFFPVPSQHLRFALHDNQGKSHHPCQ